MTMEASSDGARENQNEPDLVAAGGGPSDGPVGGVFPLLRLDRDVLSVILGLLSPQRVLWGVGLVCRQLSRASREPLMWRLMFKSRWPHVRCVGHLDTDPHDWLRLYINRRAMTHLATAKRNRQLRWMRANKNGQKRVAPPYRPCDVCGCSTKLYREGKAMARHLERAHSIRRCHPVRQEGRECASFAGNLKAPTRKRRKLSSPSS